MKVELIKDDYESIKKYIIIRDRMLNKCDYRKILPFLKSHKDYFDEMFIENFKRMDEKRKKLTYLYMAYSVKYPTKQMLDYIAELIGEIYYGESRK